MKVTIVEESVRKNEEMRNVEKKVKSCFTMEKKAWWLMNEIRVREMEDEEEEDIRYGLTLCSVFVISSFIFIFFNFYIFDWWRKERMR